MGTIANQKNGSNIQLEMQAIGSSELSIMLVQPLLGTTTDTYTVEVTQLMMSLGEERALSGNEMIFAIVERPLVALVPDVDMQDYHKQIDEYRKRINQKNRRGGQKASYWEVSQ